MDEASGCVTVVNWLVNNSSSAALNDRKDSSDDPPKAFDTVITSLGTDDGKNEQQKLSGSNKGLMDQSSRVGITTSGGGCGSDSVYNESSEIMNEEHAMADGIKQEYLSNQSSTALNEDSNSEVSEEEEFGDLLQQCYPESNNGEGRALEGQSSENIGDQNKCPFCLKVLINVTNLRRHIEKNHSNGMNQCPLCDKSYLTKWVLKKHIKDAHGEKNLQCDQCDFRTKFQQHLQLHISAVHLGEKPHKCPHCEACFSRKGALNRHVTGVHNHEKPFECSECHKRFTQRVSCDIHWRSVHCGEKPYACDLCSYRCARAAILSQHKKTVHDGVKRFPCSQCDFKTSTRSILKQHLLDLHGCMMPERKRYSVPSNDNSILSEDNNSTLENSQINFLQDHFNDTMDSTADEDLMDESSVTENSLPGGCESDSRIKLEVEDSADMNYNPSGEMSSRLSSKINDFGKAPSQRLIELHSNLNEENSSKQSKHNHCHSEEASSQHLSETESNDVAEDRSGIETMEQDNLSDTNKASPESSSDEMSDGEDFSDLLQQCYPKSCSGVTRQQTDMDRKVTKGFQHVSSLAGPCTSDLADVDNKTLQEENSIVCQAVADVLNNIKSFEPTEGEGISLTDTQSDAQTREQKYGLGSQCLQCKKAFKSQYYLAEHIRRKHLNNREHQCPQCDKSYCVKKDLTQHIKNVHSDRKFSCDKCEFTSTYRQVLRSHITSVHMDEKPHKCPVCDASFPRKCALTRHLQAVHSNERPYECAECDKTFSLRHYRDLHWRSVHCGEKPYACDQCDYRGSQKPHLKKHIRTAHSVAEKWFTCYKCDFKAQTRINLDQHVIEMHGLAAECLTPVSKRALPSTLNIAKILSEPHMTTADTGSIELEQKIGSGSAENSLMNQPFENKNKTPELCKSEPRVKRGNKDCENSGVKEIEKFGAEANKKNYTKEYDKCEAQEYNNCGTKMHETCEKKGFKKGKAEAHEKSAPKGYPISGPKANTELNYSRETPSGYFNSQFLETASQPLGSRGEASHSEYFHSLIGESSLQSFDNPIGGSFSQHFYGQHGQAPSGHVQGESDENVPQQFHSKIDETSTQQFPTQSCQMYSQSFQSLSGESFLQQLHNSSDETISQQFPNPSDNNIHQHSTGETTSQSICNPNGERFLPNSSATQSYRRLLEDNSTVNEEIKQEHNLSGETFSQHSADTQSYKRLLEENSIGQEGIKQEHTTEQSYSSSDESSEEMSDREEFSDLLHQCYAKSSSDVAAADSRDNGEGVSNEQRETATPNHRCLTCNKTFNVLTKLVRHIERKHSSERVYNCTHCDQSYSAKHALNKHMKLSHGDQLFHCEECDFSSRYKLSLKGHISAVHLKERPFKCTKCGSCFARKEALRYHVRSVHDQEKRFQCPLCGKRLCSRQSLTNHYRVIHGQGENQS